MTDDILTETSGLAGVVTFNRPKALNALSHAMCHKLEAALAAWADDPGVKLVVIRAAGERAFCAGGDVAAMYHQGRAGDFASGQAFWRDEYRLNARIAGYPKPVVAFMQGFVMGGGVGVGGHARLRVICETTQVAMPETTIGLVPDVGGSMLLGRAPGRIGEYLGITAERMGPGDALLAGFADMFLPEAEWPAAQAALIASGDLAALRARAAPAPASALAPLQAQIDRAFAGPDMAAVVKGVAAEGGDFATRVGAILARQSPLSMATTLALVRRVRGHDIRFALAQEYRVTARAAAEADFLEGVRAQLIDKDRRPRWKHPGPEAVPAAEVAALMAPLPEGEELWDMAPA